VSENEEEVGIELQDDDDEYGASSSGPSKERVKGTSTTIGTARTTPTKRRKNAPRVAASARTLRPRTSRASSCMLIMMMMKDRRSHLPSDGFEPRAWYVENR
jgi:hypothetical protein